MEIGFPLEIWISNGDLMDICRYLQIDIHRYLPWPPLPFDFGGQGDLIQQPNLILDPY